MFIRSRQWANGNGRTLFIVNDFAWGARSNILPRSEDFKHPSYHPKYKRGTKFNRIAGSREEARDAEGRSWD